jgi:hypothetical protein
VLGLQVITQKVNNMKNFDNPQKAKLVEWIVNYLVEENFPYEHLEAISEIIGLFNYCKESEKEVFEFSKKLSAEYGME